MEPAKPSTWVNRDQWGPVRPSSSLKGSGPWPRLEVWPEQLLPGKGQLPGDIITKSDCIQRRPEQTLSGMLTFS